MSLQDFWDSSLWEFQAAVEGWRRVHGAEEKPEAPSDEAFEEMLREAGF